MLRNINIFLLLLDLENDKEKLKIKLQNTTSLLLQNDYLRKVDSNYFENLHDEFDRRLNRFESPGLYF